MSLNEEKTEKPTPKRLQKEREKGNVPKSTTLTFALFLFASLMILAVLTHFFSFKRIFYYIFSHLNELTIGSALKTAFSFWNVLFVFLIAAFFAIFGANLLQTGWIWVTKREKGKRKKRGSYFFPVLKMGVAGLITYLFILSIPLNKWIFSSPKEKEQLIISKIFWLFVLISLGFILLGICDFFYQRWLYFKKLRMSPYEIREEKREEETNENMKAKQKEPR